MSRLGAIALVDRQFRVLEDGPPVSEDDMEVYPEWKRRTELWLFSTKLEEEKKQKEADQRAASRARLKERMKMFEQNQ